MVASMMASVIFQPPIPPGWILAGALALGATAIAAYARRTGVQADGWRRAALAWLRLGAIAALAIVLMRPMLPEAQPLQGLRPLFRVLVDTSGSMNVADVTGPDGGARTRLQAVAESLRADDAAWLAELRRDFDVEMVEFGDTVQPVTLDQLIQPDRPVAQRTDIASALGAASSVTGGRRLAGLLMISDGRDNAGGGLDAAALHLKSARVPVWTSAVGTVSEAKDVYVSARLSQNYLFVKQQAAVVADIAQSGYDGWYAQVTLFREDEKLTSQQVMLREGGARVEFPVREPAKGLFKYAVEAEILRDEADRENNRRALFARVVDEKPKVLLVEAEPSWDSKFLQRVLREDPNIEVTSLFHLSPKKVFGIQERTSAETLRKEVVATGPSGGADGIQAKTNPNAVAVSFPATREELYRYDCLIFGRGMDSVLTDEQTGWLKDYLADRGGGIIFARGRPYAQSNPALAAIEPVVWADDRILHARFELTPEGRLNPAFAFGGMQPADVTIRELPPMASIARVDREKSLAVVLARTDKEASPQQVAVIAYQRYGKGKAMTISSAGLWRWAFLSEESAQGKDDVFRRFWSQMIRWMNDESDFLPGQDVAFGVDRYTYLLGEKVRFTVRSKHAVAATNHSTAQVGGPGGLKSVLALEPVADSPGMRVAWFTPEREGEYDAVLQGDGEQGKDARVRFTVYSDAVENRFVAVNRDLLGRLSRTTGGETIALENLRGLAARVRSFEAAARDHVKPKDAWDRAWVFWFIAMILVVEWWLRRTWGLT
jgi:hypothetical protein